MIECYFCTCINHHKDEPFCKMNQCIAGQTELDEYTRIRLEYLNRNDIEFVTGGGERALLVRAFTAIDSRDFPVLSKQIDELLAQPEQEPISENILNDLAAQIEQYENQMAQIDEICVNYICSKGKKDPLTKDLINSIHKVV